MSELRKELLYLSERNVHDSGLTVGETVKIVEGVFKAHGEGEALVPAKITLDLTTTGKCSSMINSMPAYVGPLEICGVKWAGMNFENPKKHGLPSVVAMIILSNPETLLPIAVVSANRITAMRTGAATAVGAKYLARKDSRIVCIVGAGYQGRFQLSALNEVLKVKEARIVDTNEAARTKYAKEMGEQLRLRVEPAEDLREAVEGADVIVTVTNADKPLIQKEWIKEGCFIAAVGSYQELDFRAIKVFDKIVVDHREQIKHRGELAKWYERGLMSDGDIYAALGDIVAGKKLGRAESSERILLVPIGMGSEDVATAYRVHQLAKEKGLGQQLDSTL